MFRCVPIVKLSFHSSAFLALRLFIAVFSLNDSISILPFSMLQEIGHSNMHEVVYSFVPKVNTRASAGTAEGSSRGCLYSS